MDKNINMSKKFNLKKKESEINSKKNWESYKSPFLKKIKNYPKESGN